MCYNCLRPVMLIGFNGFRSCIRVVPFLFIKKPSKPMITGIIVIVNQKKEALNMSVSRAELAKEVSEKTDLT